MNEGTERWEGKRPDPQPGAPPPTPRLQLTRRRELEDQLRQRATDPALLMELAQIYREEQRPLEAKRVLKLGLEIYPDHVDLRWQFEEAVLARSLQQFREANDLAARVNSAEADQELENAQRDWNEQRITVCRDRLARDASQLHLAVVLAEALCDAEQFDEAIAALEPLLSGDDYGPQAYLIKGRCEIAMGQLIEALTSLRAAAMRREVPAPPKIRVAGLRLLRETATQLELTATAKHYRRLADEAAGELDSDAVG